MKEIRIVHLLGDKFMDFLAISGYWLDLIETFSIKIFQSFECLSIIFGSDRLSFDHIFHDTINNLIDLMIQGFWDD